MFARSFVVASLVLATAVLAETDVVTLTNDNFSDIIAKEKLVLVKFFAPWCGHCQAMAADFESVATQLKGQAVLGDVDATKEEDLAKKFKIDGFPTLKLFADGEEVVDYNGGRDKESMIKFIERANVPPFANIDSPAAYAKFLKENSGKNILVAAELEKANFGKFRKAAFGLRDVMPDSIEFAMVESAAHVDIKDFAAGDIYLLRVEMDGSHGAVKYDTDGEETLDKFVKSSALPAWQEFTQENAELYTELTNPLIVAFFTDCSGKECKALEAIAKKKAGNGKVVFAWVNSETLNSFQDYVGLKDAKVPICAYAFESDARYMLPEGFEFSEAGLESWVDEMIAGTVIPARKSEPIPEENEGPVYTVVGDSWADIVGDPKHDVIIAQVAEWCGHCKALKPKLRKVAEELKKAGVEHIKFATMDATENDAPEGYKAKGFPTVHFFAAGDDKKGVDFDGERTCKGIIEWLQKNSSKKFEFDVESLGEDPEPEPEEEGEGEDDEDEDDDDDEDDAEDDADDAEDEPEDVPEEKEEL